MHPEPTVDIHLGDNLPLLAGFADASFDLIYIDPPFNTGSTIQHTRLRVTRDPDGKRRGFSGRRYRTEEVSSRSFADSFDDYIAFLWPRFEEAHRLLKPEGSFFLHLDYREVHYAKVALDLVFGRRSFQNEIIWAYDYGGRSRKKWPAKHDTILWYSKHPKRYTFHYEAMDRIPYMAPGLVGKKKALRGKTPTDVWWHTIVPTTGSERTGYPTQKPEGVLRRIVAVHSSPGERLLDFFAGSGTLGAVAAELGRSAVLIDQNPEAVAVMQSRLARWHPRLHPGQGEGEGLEAKDQQKALRDASQG